MPCSPRLPDRIIEASWEVVIILMMSVSQFNFVLVFRYNSTVVVVNHMPVDSVVVSSMYHPVVVASYCSVLETLLVIAGPVG